MALEGKRMNRNTGVTKVAVLAAALAVGCSNRSQVAPVAPAQVAEAAAPTRNPGQGPVKRICVVRNPRVVGNFLEMYLAGLESKGYAVTVVEKNPQPSECPLSTRYTAFRELIQVEVYRDGKPVGNAALRGYYSETTVKELVGKLLP
jgi:hypothetical protein